MELLSVSKNKPRGRVANRGAKLAKTNSARLSDQLIRIRALELEIRALYAYLADMSDEGRRDPKSVKLPRSYFEDKEILAKHRKSSRDMGDLWW